MHAIHNNKTNFTNKLKLCNKKKYFSDLNISQKNIRTYGGTWRSTLSGVKN